MRALPIDQSFDVCHCWPIVSILVQSQEMAPIIRIRAALLSRLTRRSKRLCQIGTDTHMMCVCSSSMRHRKMTQVRSPSRQGKDNR